MSTESPQAPFHVAIIGGGIAGLTLAIGLLTRNIKVTVYERSASLREIGAGIGFTANAERAMDVIDPRVRDAFRSVKVQNGTDWFYWVDGVKEPNTDKSSVAAEELVHKMYLGVRGFEGCQRAEFLDALSRLMPDGLLQFGRNLDQIKDIEEEGQVMLKFTDGSVEYTDVVIGCDGIHSRVKQLILGSDNMTSQATYTHKYAFRGLIPMAQARAVLGDARTETRHMYLGVNSHALTFPVAGGSLLNVVAFTTDPNPWPFSDKFTATASKADAVEAFAGCNSTVRSIIALLPDVLNKWAVFDTYDNPPPNYTQGRVCLAGDAAHAAAPYHGAGAGFAIEDGAVLAHLLSAVEGVDSREGVVSMALKAYEDTRMGRAKWLVESSRRMGDMYQGRDMDVGGDWVKCAGEIEWRSRRIWDYDVEDIVARAEQTFKEMIGKL